ncbi:uncharacterized protein LOC126380965 [Pectinophora gossypiella]|uniref:uncharacterized protein LOC126380965 n=1 Tax=Pectinophora gossypiella TaxID=13191 RepID=UPI00214E4443|nr:uncharacterized protein LOC126380965 [Pectinophora gossypiella]
MRTRRRVQALRKFAQNKPKTDGSHAAVKHGPSKEVKKDRIIHKHNQLSAKSLLDIVSFQNLHGHSPVVLVDRLSHNFETGSQNGRETGSRATSVGSGVHRPSGGRDLAKGCDASSGREGKRSTTHNDTRVLTARLEEPNHIKDDDTSSIAGSLSESSKGNREDERPMKDFKVNNQNTTALQATPERGPSASITRPTTKRALATRPTPSRAPSSSTSSQDGECFKRRDLPIGVAKSDKKPVPNRQQTEHKQKS